MGPVGVVGPDLDAQAASAAEFDVQSNASVELECPVCYQTLCEPVRAGCGRHVFCRNCLLNAQRFGVPPRCPVCRGESLQDAAELEEVAELAEPAKRRDPSYGERAAAAKNDREDYDRVQLMRASQLSTTQTSRRFEVCGAGSSEVNGVYTTTILPTYVGPMVYKKPNTYLFIYRWHQTQWIIAELHGPYSMGNEREWLYCARTQHPPHVPPSQGWEVPALGRAGGPPPEVRILEQTGDSQLTVQGAVSTRRSWAGAPSRTGGHASDEFSADNENPPVSCRCSPACAVM